jgi:hypothetical protein
MFTLKVLRVLFALAVIFALDEADGRHFSSTDLLQMISKLRRHTCDAFKTGSKHGPRVPGSEPVRNLVLKYSSAGSDHPASYGNAAQANHSWCLGGSNSGVVSLINAQ